MSAIIFLLGAVVIAAIGIGVLVYVSKEPPRSSLSSIDDFARQKQAMAPRANSGRHKNSAHAGNSGQAPSSASNKLGRGV
ncbi:MAG: hypothetical protein DCC49_12310 [Acidobacteria bacterium]|nr:MAG: hypothetical protein DCC49_12310 [Acidobacteriota bacterium]